MAYAQERSLQMNASRPVRATIMPTTRLSRLPSSPTRTWVLPPRPPPPQYPLPPVPTTEERVRSTSKLSISTTNLGATTTTTTTKENEKRCGTSIGLPFVISSPDCSNSLDCQSTDTSSTPFSPSYSYPTLSILSIDGSERKLDHAVRRLLVPFSTRPDPDVPKSPSDSAWCPKIEDPDNEDLRDLFTSSDDSFYRATSRKSFVEVRFP